MNTKFALLVVTFVLLITGFSAFLFGYIYGGKVRFELSAAHITETTLYAADQIRKDNTDTALYALERNGLFYGDLLSSDRPSLLPNSKEASYALQSLFTSSGSDELPLPSLRAQSTVARYVGTHPEASKK